MNQLSNHKNELNNNGYSVIEDVYLDIEVQSILSAIEAVDQSKDTFRKSSELFAIRQFLKEVPVAFDLIFNHNLKQIINEVMGDGFFVVKSIYFDKPASSNWYVSYHQDLTISVDKKMVIEHYGPWTVKQNQYAVQAPVELLENIVTIRIHMDDTDENNGALKVVSGSNNKKIYRPETINWEVEKEEICKVKQGGIMLMKPLTLHSSGRTINNKKRRVIHIEFSNLELPSDLQWSERMSVDNGFKGNGVD